MLGALSSKVESRMRCAFLVGVAIAASWLPDFAQSQVVTELAWEAAADVGGTQGGLVTSDEAGSGTQQVVCAASANDGIVVGSTTAGGACKVAHGDLAWLLSSFDVLTGATAAWETPEEPGSAFALPAGRMVLAGHGAGGEEIYPCRAAGVCQRWNSQENCLLHGAPVGHVETDADGNAACIVAETDSGSCLCARFDVLVAP